MTSRDGAWPDDLPPPTLVEDEDGLDRLIGELEDATEIAVDTEADSFFHYREKLCLVQISVGGEDYLVDPLADLDLSPLGPIFEDPNKVKIFHDGEYDVLLFKAAYGFRFRGLFDTRIAAAALGEKSPGLASVLHDSFGLELDKKQQRSDWSRRPLSPEQVSYARLDTRYLVELMDLQIPQLEARGRRVIVDGECRRIEALEPVERVVEPDDFVKVKGVRGLKPMVLQRLRELFVLRDGMAKDRDVPAFKVLSGQGLIEIAERDPRSEGELGGLRWVSARQARRLWPGVKACLDRADELGPLRRIPEKRARSSEERLDEVESELHDRLKTWRKERAEAEELDSSLVLNRLVLLRLAKQRPRTVADLGEVQGLLPWQVELFGEALLVTVAEFERALAAGEVRFDRPRRRGRGRG